MSTSATIVVPTMSDATRIRPLLDSLRGQLAGNELIVVDNASPDPALAAIPAELPNTRVLRLERNVGFSRAVNLAAAQATGEVLILVNDDCVCDPGFVAALAAAVDPAADVTMAASVMRDPAQPDLIDSAGMRLDRTLLVFDYLNGEPLGVLDGGVRDPVGPSAAAAAFDRAAFLAVGGFDERLFAYWEDVDLVIRLRRAGGRCVLVPEARGTHEHSATLGSGSARKNYLMGFGRGYVLRKWRVLNARRALPALARELVICAGQAVLDRNLTGLRGRLRGYRTGRPEAEFPAGIGLESRPWELARTLAARARRRARLRRRGQGERRVGAAGSP
ncbi:MAG: glycosyltransferase family 2 protein [Thermoleophilia bacterium]|nr:glycosyltransferase family 2 protein [Thermoleophilia bacterium]